MGEKMKCPNCNIVLSKSPNGAYKCPQCIFVTFENLEKITKMWAFVSVDSNGNEGIIACQHMRTRAVVPMVAGSEKLMNEFREDVKDMAEKSDVKIKLIRFTVREDLEVFE